MTPQEITFRQNHLFDKDEILQSIALSIEYYQAEPNYTDAMRKNTVELFEGLLSAVKKMRIPVLRELWKYYYYEITSDAIELRMCEADIKFDDNGDIDYSTEENCFVLTSVKCKYLSVEEYSIAQGVTPATVNKWIHRGKLKNARIFNNTWMIPAVEERPERGYSTMQYLFSQGPISIEEYPLIALSDAVFFHYNSDKKCVICDFDNWDKKMHECIELTVEEAEELEYKLISTGKVETSFRTQFVPLWDKDLTIYER